MSKFEHSYPSGNEVALAKFDLPSRDGASPFNAAVRRFSSLVQFGVQPNIQLRLQTGEKKLPSQFPRVNKSLVMFAQR